MCWGIQSLRASAHEKTLLDNLRPGSLLGMAHTRCGLSDELWSRLADLSSSSPSRSRWVSAIIREVSLPWYRRLPVGEDSARCMSSSTFGTWVNRVRAWVAWVTVVSRECVWYRGARRGCICTRATACSGCFEGGIESWGCTSSVRINFENPPSTGSRSSKAV